MEHIAPERKAAPQVVEQAGSGFFGQEAGSEFSTDGRPETAQLKQLQAAADASPQVQQFRELQQNVTDSPMQQEAIQRKGTLEQHSHVPLDNRGGLPDGLRSGIEQLSGMDMGDVRVHRNSGKAGEAGALAYAQGSDIHLAPGQEQHLPHEAWHVVQQRQGRVQPTTQAPNSAAVNDDAALEAEADAMGAKAMQMKMAGNNAPQLQEQQTSTPVQRKAAPAAQVLQRMVAEIELEDFELEERKENAKKVDLKKDESEKIQIDQELIKKDEEEDKIETEPSYVIKTVHLCGRPEEGLHKGTDGDHSTAYGVSSIGLALQLRGKTMEEGFKVLSTFFLASCNLPGMKLKGNLPKLTEKKIDEKVNLIGDLLKNPENLKPELQLTNLQLLIRALLELRELLPLASVFTKGINVVGAGKGNGESKPLAVFSNAFSIKKANDQKGIEIAAIDLFDHKAVIDILAALEENKVTKTEDPVLFTGQLVPGLHHKSTLDERIQLFVEHHIMSIMMAFPEIMIEKTQKSLYDNLTKILKVGVVTSKAYQKENNSILKLEPRETEKEGFGTLVQVDPISKKITKTDFAGRTLSPFPSSQGMGAHTTAWTVHEDIMVNKIMGKTVSEAIQACFGLAKELALIFEQRKSLFKGYPEHHILLEDKWEELKVLYDLKEPKDEALKICYLQNFIRSYLTVLNILPGSTINSGSTGGNAEGIHRSTVINYKDLGKEKLVHAMLSLLDISESMDIFQQKILLQQHFDFIHEAYPDAYIKVFGDKKLSENEIQDLLKQHPKLQDIELNKRKSNIILEEESIKKKVKENNSEKKVEQESTEPPRRSGRNKGKELKKDQYVDQGDPDEKTFDNITVPKFA